MTNVTKQEARRLIGKSIYAVRKDGSVVTGKLERIEKDRLIIKSFSKGKGKKMRTKAILPLVLFDLLAIGTAPFAFGPYGFGGYGGYGYGGYPGFYY
ncbi:50S ribosomal protein L33 [Paenibacillus abyssi]|uniref:50S ribosomal protein L33 n=1 Tax=Paenibacillus abyssi TaxID=1340531 RepID=A0A917D034_9BACL|nr:50S ribosomal protein L33 [Paenibacillus abyssi]GGG04527.1 hypothetical protein GCM10010916_21970 [Paenibacillus abyssi]